LKVIKAIIIITSRTHTPSDASFFANILALGYAFASSWKLRIVWIYIHINHPINTHQHPTPTPLGKLYKRVLVVPSSTSQQRAFVWGACKNTTKFGVALFSLLDPLFTRSGLTWGCIV